MKPVKLKDIIDEMEMQMDEYHKYRNGIFKKALNQRANKNLAS